LAADLLLHKQDRAAGLQLRSAFSLNRHGDLERATFLDSDADVRQRRSESKNLATTSGPPGPPPAPSILGIAFESKNNVLGTEPGFARPDNVWDPVFESNNEAFFAVGYGATRRVETPESLDLAARTRMTFLRAQRFQSLFQESFSLIPLRKWWPGVRGEHPTRPREIERLLNRLLKPSRCTFTGKWRREGDSLFEHGGLEIEFRNLSDGYRAFIGWAADLLFHASYGCPRDHELVDLRGIVMVDEIDLHLHPRWQMKVISTIARALPLMQFILTSHSPLVASSLERMNIITLKLNHRSNSTRARRLEESIHGLDADQVLLSRFFGLSTTRASEKANKLDELTLKARRGDDEAARQLIAELAEGMEGSE
jgi:hypothetical protein